MILLLDNYDSFVYNLARYVRELGCETTVVRNDQFGVPEIAAMRPAAIIISPGPCTPAEAGISIELIRQLSDRIPMLGVCLGHQAIAAAFGGKVIRANEPVHGRTSLVRHDGNDLFAGLPNPLRATRYHSLIVDRATLPSVLRITAETADGIPMAVSHQHRPVYGVQFHPESILTQSGRPLIGNFLRLAGVATQGTPVSEYDPPPAEPAWITPGATGQRTIHW